MTASYVRTRPTSWLLYHFTEDIDKLTLQVTTSTCSCGTAG